MLPVPPGGAGDIIARLLTDQVGRAQKRTFVIETRPGAGTMIGTEAVARAPADGNTLLINAPFLLIGPHLRKVAFRSAHEPGADLLSRQFTGRDRRQRVFAVSNLRRSGAGRPRASRRTQLCERGPGTTHHIGFEKLKRASGLDFIYVPYSGGAPAINALLGNHVTAVLAEYAPLSEHLKSGNLRALAVTSKTRIPFLPELPTVAETYADFEVDFWWGLFAPAQTPKTTVADLVEWFKGAMEVQELKAKLTALGFFPTGTCGAPFAELLRKQSDDYGRVIREANIRAD